MTVHTEALRDHACLIVPGPDKFVTDLSAMLADKASTAPEGATTGPVKLHFYTFGGLLATADWARGYSRAQS